MEAKRLDLDAPLLSVRRFASSAPAPRPPSSPSTCRKAAPPFYRSDLKSGPVGNPGVVPFLWEQSAGEPKDKPKANPAAAVQALLGAEHRTRGGDPDEDDDDGIADALETLSRTESCFMTCSISGTAGGEIDGRAPPPGRFSEDPPGRDFVMGRFLPAAQAMASSAPQSAPRRPPVLRRPAAESPAATSPHQRRPSYSLEQASLPHSDIGEDDDDDDGGDVRHLSLQGCGLLPMLCMKGSYLLGPLSGTKTRGRMPAAAGRSSLLPQQQQQRRAPLRASASDAEDEHIWEEVYEHKLGRVRQKLGEEASRWTSESNQLSFWSDSPTADGSSSWRRSTGGGGGAPRPMIEETGDGDSIPKAGEKPSLGHRAVNSDEQLRLLDGGGKQTMDDALPAPLPPPLPESPSDSWLSRTLPTVASKGSAPLPFLGIQLGRKKQTTGASSTDSRVGNYNQGEGDDHGQGAVLVNPVNGD
ncbi:unnamed protein product [Spirodela intermedia]|uniref:Uncharacterized protein n=1 Tax=Spirodela intermedia TaxID=51605 RepID=A0A7I8KX65_SPIIN|nr:unnamed protein product [Spirodela intermedia]